MMASKGCEDFLSSLPDGVLDAATICSIPHWVNDTLAILLVSKFGRLNGEAKATVGYLKSLPIVSPYETRGWRLVPRMRIVLQDRIIDTNLYTEISDFLGNQFDGQSHQVGYGSLPWRELTWRAAYHEVVVRPEKAIERLDQILVRSDDEPPLSELKAAVDLIDERLRWIPQSCRTEIAYFRGRYAYACQDYKTAQDWLLIVWNSGGKTRQRAIAGHMLGVMWRKSRQPELLSKAESTLRDAVELCEQLQDDIGTCHTCNTLAATLRDMGGRQRLEEARRLAERAFRISAGRDFIPSIAVTSLTLATILCELDQNEDWNETHDLLQYIKKLGERYKRPQLVYSARMMEGLVHLKSRDWIRAADCLREAAEMEQAEATVHTKLAMALMQIGEAHFQEAKSELLLARRLDPADKSANSQLQRLNKMLEAVELRDSGAIEARSALQCYALGKASESIGDRSAAIRSYERAIELGDDRSVVRYRLGRLLAPDEDRRSEAIRWLSEAVAKGLRDTPTLASLARSLQKVGRTDEAESYFKEAIRKDPKLRNTQLRNWYGLFLLEVKKDYEGAYEFTHQALQLSPSTLVFANDVARVILEARWHNKFSEARALLEQAIMLSDESFRWPRILMKELDKLEGRERSGDCKTPTDES